MGVISPHVSDDEVVSNLRQEFDREDQYAIDFKYWLHTAYIVRGGVLVTVKSRKFLLHQNTGTVIREVFDNGC